MDTNNDEVLTLEELSKQPIAYLETRGERKLEIIYKPVKDRELRLDLYYPTVDTAKSNSPHSGNAVTDF